MGRKNAVSYTHLNAYQYADPGTDHKYPESDLYASGSDQPAGEADESLSLIHI